MDSVKEKLNLITNIWNQYFLEEKFFQDKIKYTDEVKENYYGNIMHYLFDTFEILEKHEVKKNEKKEFYEYILYMVGILQIIYVQQDLIDEILRIFSESESSSDVKSKIRNFRNELVGHPISRDKNSKLISSVFWTNKLNYNTIGYIKYKSNSEIRSESIEQPLDELIKEHRNYLLEYLNNVLIKIKKILNIYKNDLLTISNLINIKKKDNKSLLKVIEIYHKSVFLSSVYMNKTILEKCLEKESDGDRYKNLVNLFLEKIKLINDERLESIKNYVSKINEEYVDKEVNLEIPKINIVFKKSSELAKKEDINKKKSSSGMLNYYLEKLFEKKQFKNIDILLKNYSSNKKIVDELENMRDNIWTDDLEYYSSLLLVEKLIQESNNA